MKLKGLVSYLEFELFPIQGKPGQLHFNSLYDAVIFAKTSGDTDSQDELKHQTEFLSIVSGLGN